MSNPGPKRSSVDYLLKAIATWVRRLLGEQPTQRAQIVLWTRQSPRCLLLCLQRDTPQAVATYRANILHSAPGGQPQLFDVLIFLDTLEQLPGTERVQRFYAVATHRLTILEISRMNSKSRCLWMADLDMVGSRVAAGNRYARRITEEVAGQLLLELYDRIDWDQVVDTSLKRWLGPTSTLWNQPQQGNPYGPKLETQKPFKRSDPPRPTSKARPLDFTDLFPDRTEGEQDPWI